MPEGLRLAPPSTYVRVRASHRSWRRALVQTACMHCTFVMHMRYQRADPHSIMLHTRVPQSKPLPT